MKPIKATVPESTVCEHRVSRNPVLATAATIEAGSWITFLVQHKLGDLLFRMCLERPASRRYGSARMLSMPYWAVTAE
jgi:hypothetical protein